MMQLMGELPAVEHVVLAVDTSDLGRARELAELARDAGASIIKEGLEVTSAPNSSWEFAANNAGNAGLEWVADTKGDDIPTTIDGFIRNIVKLDHPPIAITMHTHAGVDSMREAHEIASEHGIVMLGVTELTSIKEKELREQFGFLITHLGMGELPKSITESPLEDNIIRKAFVHMRARQAAEAGLPGLVASAQELVYPINSDPELASKLTMIPATRSPGADRHDQNNVDTPEEATFNGANLLVIGREVTKSDDPVASFSNVVDGIQRGIDRRSA